MDIPLLQTPVYIVNPAEPQLALHLINYGHEIHHTCDYFQDGRKRFENVLIWQYTLKGRGELRMGEQIFPLLPGKAMIIKAPSDSCYYLPPGSDCWEFVYLTLQGPEALRMTDVFHKSFGPICAFPQEGKLLQMTRELLLSSQDHLLDPFLNSTQAYRLLMEMFAEATRGGEKEDDKLLRKIRDHILMNMEQCPEITELAAIAGCTPWHFARKFRKISGQSPLQYLLALKMQYAAQLLENTLDPIKEVARKCGYDDPSYFCKVFRKFHRISPGQFRNQEDINW